MVNKEFKVFVLLIPNCHPKMASHCKRENVPVQWGYLAVTVITKGSNFTPLMLGQHDILYLLMLCNVKLQHLCPGLLKVVSADRCGDITEEPVRNSVSGPRPIESESTLYIDSHVILTILQFEKH